MKYYFTCLFEYSKSKLAGNIQLKTKSVSHPTTATYKSLVCKAHLLVTPYKPPMCVHVSTLFIQQTFSHIFTPHVMHDH